MQLVAPFPLHSIQNNQTVLVILVQSNIINLGYTIPREQQSRIELKAIVVWIVPEQWWIGGKQVYLFLSTVLRALGRPRAYSK